MASTGIKQDVANKKDHQAISSDSAALKTRKSRDLQLGPFAVANTPRSDLLCVAATRRQSLGALGHLHTGSWHRNSPVDPLLQEIPQRNFVRTVSYARSRGAL